MAVFVQETSKIVTLVSMSHPDTSHARLSETLGVVERFLNTVDLRTFEGARRGAHGTEEIPDARALTRWLVGEHLMHRGEEASAADVRLAHALRSELRAAVETRGAGRPSSPAVGKLPLHVDFDNAGRPALVPAERDRAGRAALALIVSRAVVAAARGEWERLRVCAAEDCRWVFYDRSKPGTGRWCSMRVCGNRLKTRAYRASNAGG
jgi:predicted RNA-binding Zn ribbon-like protein